MARTFAVCALIGIALCAGLEQCTAPGSCGAVEVPDELRAVGLEIFDSEERMAAFAQGLRAPRQATLNDDLKVVMTCHSEDRASEEGNVAVLEWESSGDPYGLRTLDHGADGIILDVGANIGDTTLIFSRLFPNAQIISLEPVPTTYFVMRVNLHLNGVRILKEDDIGKKGRPGVLPLNMVVGESDLEVTWNPKDSQEAMVIPKDSEFFNWPVNHSVRRNEVVMKKDVKHILLEKFLRDRGATTIYLLKIDCEGCEYVVLPLVKNMVEDKAMVQHLIGEYHKQFAPSQAMLDGVTSILSRRDPKCLRDKEEFEFFC